MRLKVSREFPEHEFYKTISREQINSELQAEQFVEAGYWSDAGERRAIAQAVDIDLSAWGDINEVVDLGCGPDPLSLDFVTAILKQNCRKLVLVDSAQSLLEHADAQVKLRASSLESIIFSGNIFDVDGWAVGLSRPLIFISGGVFSNYPHMAWKRLFKALSAKIGSFRFFILTPKAGNRVSARRAMGLLSDSIEFARLSFPLSQYDLIYNVRFGGRFVCANVISSRKSFRFDHEGDGGGLVERLRVFYSRRFMEGDYRKISTRFGCSEWNEAVSGNTLIWWGARG
jgi:hypothetical protein